MARQIRIRAVRRKDIDIKQLSRALLRLARDLENARASKAEKVKPEVRHE